MTIFLILLISACLFAWGWRRVYVFNIRKGARSLIAHMLGFLLGIFPAQFFMYAMFATLPPSEVQPPSGNAILTLWIIFVLSVAALFRLTTRKVKPVLLDKLDNDQSISEK